MNALKICYHKMTLLVVLLTALVSCLLWQKLLQQQIPPRAVVGRSASMLDLNRTDIAGLLLGIRTQLHRAITRNTAPTQQVLELVDQLLEIIEPQDNGNVQQTSSEEVCPEVYIGPFKGWVAENCSYGKPLHELIEVALYYSSCDYSRLSLVLKGIRNTHPKIKVLIAVDSALDSPCTVIEVNFAKVKVYRIIGTNAGEVWNKIISRVKTRYVLVGRDLDGYSHHVRLERQIHVLGSIPNVKVVGGAVRNTTGHWRVGCLQLNMLNYALKYQDGYFTSKNECMFCDHLLGPFVIQRELLQSVPFSKETPSSVLFEDWFIRLHEKDAVVMNCPDVLYFATDANIEDKASLAEIWLPIARTWVLNRITWPNNPAHEFSCKKANISCSNIAKVVKYFLFPPCCLDAPIKALDFLHKFFTHTNITYELHAGTCLGAVKMADVIPWDIDADLRLERVNFTFLQKSNGVLDSSGYRLVYDKSRNKLLVYTPSMRIELYPYDLLSHEALEDSNVKKIRTKVNIHGIWFCAPKNPGLAARNRYGREILKHAQSWLVMGKESTLQPYDAGKFKPCLSRTHHACLDKFPADGGLYFNSV